MQTMKCCPFCCVLIKYMTEKLNKNILKIKYNAKGKGGKKQNETK